MNQRQNRQGPQSNFNQGFVDTPRPQYNPNSRCQNYGQRQGQTTQNQNHQQWENKKSDNSESDSFNTGPLCFRCRQYGHYQWRCPVTRMDHSKNHFN